MLGNQSRQCSSTPDVREFMGKGLTAIAEVDRLSPYTDFNDIRLRPLLKVQSLKICPSWFSSEQYSGLCEYFFKQALIC
jgi:hypothetical protein